jgi:hypothetical protein
MVRCSAEEKLAMGEVAEAFSGKLASDEEMAQVLEEPFDWESEIEYGLKNKIISPEELTSISLEGEEFVTKTLEWRMDILIHRLINLYGIPILSDGKGYWLWNGDLSDLPDECIDPKGILTAISFAKKHDWPIPTGKTTYPGRGRPYTKIDEFISNAEEAIRKRGNISQAELAAFLSYDESTIKRNLRKAGYKSYSDFLANIQD